MSEKKTPIDEELLEELKKDVNPENIRLTITSKEEREYAEEDRKNAFDDYQEYKKAVGGVILFRQLKKLLLSCS